MIARTKEVLAFRDEGKPLEMPIGTDLEISEPRNNPGHVKATWLGKVRFVPASALEGLTHGAQRLIARASRKKP